MLSVTPAFWARNRCNYMSEWIIILAIALVFAFIAIVYYSAKLASKGAKKRDQERIEAVIKRTEDLGEEVLGRIRVWRRTPFSLIDDTSMIHEVLLITPNSVFVERMVEDGGRNPYRSIILDSIASYVEKRIETKENLKAEKFAEIRPEDIFYQTGIQIKDGNVEIPDLPKSEFYFYKNQNTQHDLLIFIGESQPVMEKEYELAQRVIEVAHYYDVSEIITFAATPVNITHHTDPGVWGVSTSKEMRDKFANYNIKVMNSGHIGGLNGLLLGVGKDIGLKGSCLLGEIPFYTAKIENPKSK